MLTCEIDDGIGIFTLSVQIALSINLFLGLPAMHLTYLEKGNAFVYCDHWESLLLLLLLGICSC